MQRILVVSDSHGRDENVQAAVDAAGRINAMIHLGDVGPNYQMVARMARGVSAYIVRGNCYSTSELMDRNIISVAGHNIYATHGHRQQVNYDLQVLRYTALQNKCDIALFGHTHVPYISMGDDVSIFNPGSVSLPRQSNHRATYGILELHDDGTIHFEVCYL